MLLKLILIHKQGKEQLLNSLYTEKEIQYSNSSFSNSVEGIIARAFIQSGAQKEVFKLTDKKKLMQCLRHFDHVWGCNELYEWLETISIDKKHAVDYFLQIRIDGNILENNFSLYKIRDLKDIII